MKKLLALLLSISMLLSLGTVSFAASNEAQNAANTLHELGLFNGTGTDADGKPIYELDRTPTRAEAITMLVTLLGKKDMAAKENWTTPFKDVATWAKPYVGYAYNSGLTSGISQTEFGGTQPVTASQYLSFVLTALGYEKGTDFKWDKAWELSDKIGLTNGQYTSSKSFVRGDVAIISYNALKTKAKGSNISLIQVLNNCSAVKQGAALSTLLASSSGTECYKEYPVLPKFENVNPRATIKKQQKPTSSTAYFSYIYPFESEYEVSSSYESYISFLQAQGFIVRDTSSEYATSTTVTVPSTGKSLEVCIIGDRLNINVPIEDVTIYDDSYNTFFTLSSTELTIDRLGRATLTAKVKATENIRIEWGWYDKEVIVPVREITEVKDGYTEASILLGGVQSGQSAITASLYIDDKYYDLATCYVTVPVDIKESPVKLTNIRAKMNTVGGWTFTFNVENHGDKTIKYVTTYWYCLNAVGDRVPDAINHSSKFGIKITGPIAPGEVLEDIQNDRPFYNSTFNNTLEFVEIVVDYMDGSVEVINPTNYTNYWDL